MLLKIVNFVVVEGFVFFVLAIGAFVLSHLGLMLVGWIDAFLSRDRRPRAARPAIAGNPVDEVNLRST